MIQSLVLSTAFLLGLGLICFTALRAWRGWLDLKRAQLAGRAAEAPCEDMGVRIELAAVRDRVKKLEAIASGVEL